MADGRRLTQRSTLAQPIRDQQGYAFDDTTHVLRIHHTAACDIDIQLMSTQAQPSFLTFDTPHLAAGTPLLGQYPTTSSTGECVTCKDWQSGYA